MGFHVNAASAREIAQSGVEKGVVVNDGLNCCKSYLITHYSI
jgi:hypothetical protein